MSRRWVVGVVAGVAVVALAGCGSSQAPGSNATGTTGPSPTSPATTRPLTSQPTAADGALQCPATVASAEGMTVPEKPQGAVDGNARLLPDRATTWTVVCAYAVMDIAAAQPLTAPFPLSKRTVASPQQSAEVTDLFAWAPRWNGKPKVCTMMAGNETAYLVGSVYSDAIVWVAAKDDPNSCSNSTNGDFVSGAALGVPLHAMFGGGEPKPMQSDPCVGTSWGRLGDDQSLAPEGDPTVTVCRLAADGRYQPSRLDAGQSKQVVDVLRGLATKTTEHMCQGSDKVSEHRFTLRLDYPAGPDVQVQVDPDCAPQVLGANLQAADAGDLITLVEQWSPPIPGPDPNGSVSSGSSGPGGAPATLPVMTK